MFTFADGVTITIGHNVFTFGLNVIIYLLIAAIIGVIAEYIVGWRVPLGIIGAVVASLVGIWLMTQVIVITGVPALDYAPFYGVPLLKALIGAIIFVAIWHLITLALFRRRRPYSEA